MKLLILGRETNLCQAEAEAVFGKVEQHHPDFCLVDQETIAMDQLGGIIKVAQLIEDIKLDSPEQALSRLQSTIVNFVKQKAPTSKLSFGFSFYGDKITRDQKQLERFGLTQKKLLRQFGVSSRFVTAKTDQQLSAAQVIHNQLTGQTGQGFDFCCVLVGDRLLVGYTVAVQDIASYAQRDHGRPCRDMVVGMLPPKLAQIMINLARPEPGQTVLDPFCGSGVVLQEALLAGFDARGSDISEKMIACSQKNLAWLKKTYQINATYSLDLIDATKLKTAPDNCVIVSEGFLGRPFGGQLNKQQYQAQLPSLKQIYLDFFRSVSRLKKGPTRLVICLPVWRTEKELLKLDIIDQIIDLGYTLKQFADLDARHLVYIRQNQVVGRQLLVLKRRAT